MVGEASKIQKPRKSFLKLSRKPYNNTNNNPDGKWQDKNSSAHYAHGIEYANEFDETVIPGSVSWEEV